MPTWVLIFPIFNALAFVFVIVVMVKQKKLNNEYKKYPVTQVYAKAVGKRQRRGKSYTRYFVTFELEDETRMELAVPGPVVGLIIEGDTGSLTFQYNKFVDFVKGE